MDTFHLVDAQLSEWLRELPTRALNADTLASFRAGSWSIPSSGDCDVDTEQASIARSGAPDVPVHIYRPRGATDLIGCVVHMHGGGFVTGAASHMENFHRPLAAELGCVIVSVDYRLAPETPFPGAIEDCYVALSWTFENAARLGIDAKRIGVMGESAGGGLAAALALMARDRGVFPLAFQHLIFPMLDDRTCSTAVRHPYAGEFVWTAANNAFGWSALLGREMGCEGVSPYAAPARAQTLAGLPATFISVGALDLFVEEDIDYARRLIRAGVATELHVYPGAFHGFTLVDQADVAKSSIGDSRSALRRALQRKPLL